MKQYLNFQEIGTHISYKLSQNYLNLKWLKRVKLKIHIDTKLNLLSFILEIR